MNDGMHKMKMKKQKKTMVHKHVHFIINNNLPLSEFVVLKFYLITAELREDEKHIIFIWRTCIITNASAFFNISKKNLAL